MNITGNMPSNQPGAGRMEQNKLSQDSFMTMLLTQLKAQDPLKPFDASTMMQQIAQLTGLSASQKLADSVESMNANSGMSQVLAASQIVGKNVQLATDTLHLDENKIAAGAVVVPQGVEKIAVSIFDSAGNKVRTLNLDAPSEGVLDFSWDGQDEDGKTLDSGYYSMSATSQLSGEEIRLPTAAVYQVKSVALDRTNGGVILNVDGLGGIGMNEVIKIL